MVQTTQSLSKCVKELGRMRRGAGQHFAWNITEKTHEIGSAIRTLHDRDTVAMERFLHAWHDKRWGMGGQVFQRLVLQIKHIQRLPGVRNLEDEALSSRGFQREILIVLTR